MLLDSFIYLFFSNFYLTLDKLIDSLLIQEEQRNKTDRLFTKYKEFANLQCKYVGIFRKTNRTKYFPNTFLYFCLKHNQPLFQPLSMCY